MSTDPDALEAKRQGVLVKNNSFVEVIDSSELLETMVEMSCKLTQSDRSRGVTEREKVQYFTIKDDRLIDIDSLASSLEFGDKESCF